MIKLFRKIRWLIVPLLICVAICVLMRTVLFLGYVPTTSMEPLIPAKSWILGTRIHGELKIGDVVIFEHNGKMLVKRIAAGPGDSVYIDDLTHAVSINAAAASYTRILMIPEDGYFLLGDNVEESIDARYWQDPITHIDSIAAVMILPLENTANQAVTNCLNKIFFIRKR